MPNPQKINLSKKQKKNIEPNYTNWRPEDLPLGFSRPEPLYPSEKMSWDEFQKMEKESGFETENIIKKIDRLARKGLLNLDISSLPEPEKTRAKELIKKVKKEFYNIHGHKWWSNSVTAIIYIYALLQLLLMVGSKLVGESVPNNYVDLKSNDPQKYVKILKKNKDLRNLTGLLKQQAKTPEKTIDFLKKIVNLIEK